jgi:hypothetical protein
MDRYAPKNQLLLTYIGDGCQVVSYHDGILRTDKVGTGEAELRQADECEVAQGILLNSE